MLGHAAATSHRISAAAPAVEFHIFSLGRAACADPLARVLRYTVHCLAVTGQGDGHGSCAVFRILYVDLPVDVRRHRRFPAEFAPGCLNLHVGAR